ncbi:hypothetical protein E0K89_020300, partial [Aquicoccus sp. SCR17]|nr:hypothetical protein [Carideicomes alvinocaridis]
MTDLVVKLIRFVLLVAGIAVLVLLGLAAWTGADWAQYGPLLAALVGLACGALLLQIADRLRDLAEAQAQTNELLLAQGRARSRPVEEPGLRAEPRPRLRAE